MPRLSGYRSTPLDLAEQKLEQLDAGFNLGKLQGLGAPVASIGGAGTFDGIFVTGLIAVLLAGLTGRRTAQ